MENIIIQKSAWICIKDKKILMARSHGRDVFYNPGGWIEEGETNEQALVREVKEELLVDIVPETITQYGTFTAPAHGRPEGDLVQMNCYTADYVGELQVDDVEIAEYAWLGSTDMDKLSPAGIIILNDLIKKNLIE
jgi:8-oxo-dGTP pyrophosphatase MutT (NUDIX family)